MARIVASKYTISRADCHGVIMALSKVIGQQLVQGNILRPDELGTFSLTLQGTAVVSPELSCPEIVIHKKYPYEKKASLLL